MLVTRRTRDMKAYDEAAQERIEVLESQLLAADIENEEWEKLYTALKVEFDRMIYDRNYCP